MIVEQFLQWVTTAPAEIRAKATYTLATDYFVEELSEEDRSAAEAAMTFLLDDPDRRVRAALADAIIMQPDAPRHIILSLLEDDEEIALRIIAHSAVLIDSELIDFAATGSREFQLAVANRKPLSPGVSAAIAEVSSSEICLALLNNSTAHILPRTLLRLSQRFGGHPAIQKILLARADLPIAARQLIIANMSEALSIRAIEQDEMDIEEAQNASRDARERATMTLLRDLNSDECDELLEHLIETDQLTTVFLLRAICAGQIDFFIKALSVLSGVAEKRIIALLNDRSRCGLKSLYAKAGLPQEAYPAFAIATDVYVEEGAVKGAADQYRFTRIMIERILNRHNAMGMGSVDEILSMLRRFASETARDAARTYFNDRFEQPQISAA